MGSTCRRSTGWLGMFAGRWVSSDSCRSNVVLRWSRVIPVGRGQFALKIRSCVRLIAERSPRFNIPSLACTDQSDSYR